MKDKILLLCIEAAFVNGAPKEKPKGLLEYYKKSKVVGKMPIKLTKEQQDETDVPGNCANCQEKVYESISRLYENYKVWAGKCPYCGATNYLDYSMVVKGYSSEWMYLTLTPLEQKKRR